VYNRYEDRLRLFALLARTVLVVPAAIGHLVTYMARWAGRWYVANRAEGWAPADAFVTGTYEIDENQGILSRNGWEIDEDDDSEYYPRFAVALQYSYHADGELHTGTYFLPDTYTEGELASEAEKTWQDRRIVVRYNPSKPQQSFFLVRDGAPGKPHIPWLISDRPYVTTLSLK